MKFSELRRPVTPELRGRLDALKDLQDSRWNPVLNLLTRVLNWNY